MSLWTYEDAVQHALDYLGADVGDALLRDARRAVVNAVHDLEGAHTWSYLYARGRIVLRPQFVEGTVSFDLTGGVGTDLEPYEKLWTVAGATTPLPVPLEGGTLLIGNVTYRITRRVSATEFVTGPWAPTEDLADQSYLIFFDEYLLPPDFSAGGQLFREKPLAGMDYMQLTEHLEAVRRGPWVGTPRSYAITGATELGPGRMAMVVYPAPLQEKTVDFVYRRRCSDLTVYRYDAGAVSLAGDAVTGVGTLFGEDLVGSVLRISADRTKPPTGWVGNNPPAYEGIVTAAPSATTLTVSPAGGTLAAVKYSVSSLLDVDQGTMLAALQRGIEYQVSIARVVKDKPSARGLYMEALKFAKAADSRSFAGRVVGGPDSAPKKAGGSIQYVRGGVT